ncbi:MULTISPECIES: hypothetical protein [Trichocoleus]|uniref:Uncharacterized protein n=1 Tax=Trichocoleus desertorum GB2-A4 TaxID=2933944 RepID=A0ABV0J4B5_9CYAN|nr:hypothetical protein [Trichocoleus sp. FACHB-46]MBD1861961.1 hypothetical protein [Trichocoleus sp. FACHB-46]
MSRSPHGLSKERSPKFQAIREYLSPLSNCHSNSQNRTLKPTSGGGLEDAAVLQRGFGGKRPQGFGSSKCACTPN